MILRDRPHLVPAADFAEGLQRVLRGVARLDLPARFGSSIGSMVTGWLITDTLVVSVEFAVSPEEEIRCLFSVGPTKHVWADLLSDQPKTTDRSLPTLFRLRQPMEGRALTLGFESARADDPVCLLHHAQGRPELALSMGRLVAAEPPWLRYDADTEAGSSGGPVFDSGWGVIGMHTQRGHASDPSGPRPSFNQGLSLSAILDALRLSPEWGEIAEHHRLANVTAARIGLEIVPESSPAPAPTPSADDALLKAAVRWNFDPGSFSTADAERLKPLVIDSKAERWTLRGPDRQRLLTSAGSLEVLREARGTDESDYPGQRVIDRILQGPPYDLEEIEEVALPHWLQAVRWFAEIEPSLPTAREVNRTLERRRTRSRLRAIARPDFRGRAVELAALRAWYDRDAPGPMVVSGIGGIGKSALVAKFAADLPEETLLLWLDFDRADLAPDDAVSVLKVLAESLAAQRDDFHPPKADLDPDQWQAAADGFGAELARLVGQGPPPLLVLDGFEVAQHVQRHEEIWGLLDRVLAQVQSMRVLVSGRAPVSNLKLGGRAAVALELKGMEPADAAAWLREHKVSDEEVIERVLKIAEGVPLILRLAARLVEEGGKVHDLPEALPRALVEGYLYDRILKRVIDPEILPVARDALVLRRLNLSLLAEVLAASLPEGREPQDVFDGLAREMAIVAGEDAGPAEAPNVLRLRPEVRSATLRLLEMDSKERVRAIDERAAAWYARQDTQDIANAAERVYHLLRLGRTGEAEKAWSAGCANLLRFAPEDLAKAPRAWLVKRIGEHVEGLEEWENDVARRIHKALERGLLRVIPAYLAERPERSRSSPLVFYDAWTKWNAGDLGAARALLAAGKASGVVGRDQAVLAAFLAARAGDRDEADRLLATADGEDEWRDRPDGPLAALAVRAARIRLTVDLEKELELAEALALKREHDALE